jgi:putative phage-type endonuclease
MSAALQLASPFYDEVADSDDRAAWLRIRRTGIGASEAAIIIGESRWKTPARLWTEKRALLEVEEDVPDGDTAEYLEWGLRHEPTILAAYSSERYANRPASRVGKLLRSRAHAWSFATLDAWTIHPDHGRIPLELKTSEVWRSEAWADGCPRAYWWQLQHQMMVTGAPCASIACLLGVHRLVWDDVERDEFAIDRLRFAGARFWDRVERGEIPPGPLDRPSLAAVYPRDDGSMVELGGEWIEVDDERVGLKERASAIEKRLEQIDDELRGAIGRRTLALIPNGAAYTLKADARGRRTLRRKAPKEGRDA